MTHALNVELILPLLRAVASVATDKRIRTKTKHLSARTSLIRLVCVSFALVGCGPSGKKEEIKTVEQGPAECFDKICAGDVAPKYDSSKEVALKLNGEWFIAPKDYYSTGRNGAVFYWPERRPGFAVGEFPPQVKGKKFDDVAIEIFLSTPQPPRTRTMYRTLLELESEGKVLEKRVLRPGLERWQTKDSALAETWYIATALREPAGDPPVTACRGREPSETRCLSGFMWMSTLAANLRFKATFAADWPEIYLEAVRVLELLRKA